MNEGEDITSESDITNGHWESLMGKFAHGRSTRKHLTYKPSL